MLWSIGEEQSKMKPVITIFFDMYSTIVLLLWNKMTLKLVWFLIASPLKEPFGGFNLWKTNRDITHDQKRLAGHLFDSRSGFHHWSDI